MSEVGITMIGLTAFAFFFAGIAISAAITRKKDDPNEDKEDKDA